MPGEPNEVNWRGVRPVSGIRGVWPARNSVRVYEEGYQSSRGTAIVYTVPANKKLFISGHLLSSLEETGAFATMRMGVRNSDDALMYWMQYQYYDIPGQQTTPMAHQPALEAEAGYDVFVQSSHTYVSGRGLIFGWLEDA